MTTAYRISTNPRPMAPATHGQLQPMCPEQSRFWRLRRERKIKP